MDRKGLSSFLLGLGVGVGIGMLFAPKSGRETRQLIKDKAGEGTEYLKQRGTDIRQTASEWVDKGKDAINRQKDNLADAMEAGRQAYRDVVGRPSAENTQSPQ
ncbi:MAG TPA: YtxH domain-containing protein [Verrucomicrobiae bacterium]|nr:YtxH domain-containing protein [Verrucomicrobiae bacterium]